MRNTLLFALGALLLPILFASCGREAPVGTLEVVSEPAGASVQILDADGTKTSPAILTTPVSQTLATGPYRVVVTMDGHLVTPSERVVQVTPARLTRAEFTLARLGTLTVGSDPAGAAVWIDGEDTGEVTPHDFVLVEGDHLVEVRLDGHVIGDGPSTVTVDGDEPQTADYELLPAGWLAVTSDPAGADVLIDGEAAGSTTPALLEVAAGERLVAVSRAGWIASPEELAVSVAIGDTSTAAFTLVAEGTLGDLVVTSIPAGAAIVLDGEETGEVTPYTFSLTPVTHSVAVHRAGFHPADAVDVTVAAGGSTPADFTLQAAKIALMETVSGVNCVGCPAMNTMLENVEAVHGPDALLGIKYSMPIGGSDIHYEANPTVLQARLTDYWSNSSWDWAAPTLFFDGNLETPPHGYPAIGDMMSLMDAALATDPGFAVEVHVADWDADPLQVTIDLIPTREVTGADAVLHFAVVESPVLYDTPPGDYGETEFHWVCREFGQVDASPLPVSPAAPGHFEVSFPKQANWTGFVHDNLWAVAFVQDASTFEVLQAGALAPASHHHAQSLVHPERSQQ